MKFIGLVLLASLASPAHAGAVLAGWDFNTDDGSPATGTLSPSQGVGSLNVVGGATNFFSSASGGFDPAPFSQDSAWSVGGFPVQGTASGTAGFTGHVSTAGSSQVRISFDYKNQPSANKWYAIDLSGDGGATWAAFDTLVVEQADVWSVYSSAIIPAIDDPANFAFRLTAIFKPGTTEYEATEAGYNGDFSLQLDRLQVTANAVPEPATLSLAAAGLLGAVAVRRKRRLPQAS